MDPKRYIFFGILIFLMLAQTESAFAQEPENPIGQEQFLQSTDTERRAKAALRFRELALAEERARQIEKPRIPFLDKFDMAVSYLESLDRNANYDSDHKRDWTQQITVDTYFQDAPFARMRYQFDYHLDTALHARFPANDSFIQETGGRTDLQLNEKLILDTSYHWGYFRYPDSTLSSYFRSRVITGLKHYLFKTTRIYHRPNFTWELKNYRYRKARITLNDVAVNTDTKREDIVYRLDHEIGLEPYKTVRLVVHNQWGFNESNDAHQDFYDYSYFRTSQLLSASYKKWYVFSGFQFQRNNFTARRQLGTAEAEDLPIVFGGIFYSLSRYLSLGFNATYFKSDSNFPDLEYQGATFTLGAYSNFKPSDLLKTSSKLFHLN